MPSPDPNSGLRDNHTRGTVGDFLRGKLRDGSRLSVVSAYFTIYAYDALKDSLGQIDHLDFLFGEPSFVNRLDPNKTEKKSFIIDADGLELANKLQQKRVAKECADWIERKVDIKTIKQSNLLHGKMYHVATAGVLESLPARLYENVLMGTPEALRELLIPVGDADVDVLSELDVADRGRLKNQRKRLRALFQDEHWKAMGTVKLIDEVLDTTERVLNPGAHDGESPFYEHEVEKALDLISKLEKCLP